MSVRRFVQVSGVALLVALAWALPARAETSRLAATAPDTTRSVHRLLESLASDTPGVEAVRVSVIGTASDVGSNRSSTLPALLVLAGIAVLSLGRSRRAFLVPDAGPSPLLQLAAAQTRRGPPRRALPTPV